MNKADNTKWKMNCHKDTKALMHEIEIGKINLVFLCLIGMIKYNYTPIIEIAE